jgi:Domain of unknown function (DUF1992)
MDAIAWIAEQRIREAMDQGFFDNSPYRGRRVDLEEDESIAPELRMAFKVLKDAGYLPPEVELRREVATLPSSSTRSPRARSASASGASCSTAASAWSCSAGTAEGPEAGPVYHVASSEAPCE